MIRTLRVRNFGVIEEVEVELGAGLTVMTGETGAGKSMLLDALMLLAGGRADTGMLRSGCDEAAVEGVFALSPELATRLDERGLEAGGDEVLVRRTISAQGRGKAWVNGCLVTVSVLQQVMRGFVDIAGQLEHASLYDEDNHRALVDRCVHHRRECAECDHHDPGPVVRTRHVEDPPAEPGTEEAADLVTEEHHAAEQSEVPHAVDLADQLNDLRREPDQNLGDRESLAVNARKERRQVDV
jgi:hypothetical protein